MNKTKSFRRISVLVLAVLLMTTTILCGTFAKYATTFTPEGSVSAAAWNVEVNGATAENTALTLTPSKYTNVKAGTDGKDQIAPGTTGYFTVKVENKGDVDLNYTLTFAKLTGETYGDFSMIKFYYADENGDISTNEITATEGTYTYDLNGDSEGNAFALNYAGGTTASNEVKIWWSWAYETENGDATDTALAGKLFGIEATVIAEQATPVAQTAQD